MDAGLLGPVRILAVAVVGSLSAQPPPAPPAEATPAQPASPEPLTRWGEEARVHAVATLIVRGVLHVDAAAVKEARRSGGYANVQVDVRETVYGPLEPAVTFRVHVHADGDPSAPPLGKAENVLALEGQDRIAFLLAADRQNYLADGYHGRGLIEPERDAIVRIRKREMLHRQWLARELPQDAGRRDAVTRLLAGVCEDSMAQRKALVALQELGDGAVVELIAAMDDRRKLPAQVMTFTGRQPDGRPVQRRCRPELVVDAMTSVLNQLTGESLGWIYNGGTEAERDAVVRAWRLYAHYQIARRAGAREGR